MPPGDDNPRLGVRTPPGHLPGWHQKEHLVTGAPLWPSIAVTTPAATEAPAVTMHAWPSSPRCSSASTSPAPSPCQSRPGSGFRLRPTTSKPNAAASTPASTSTPRTNPRQSLFSSSTRAGQNSSSPHSPLTLLQWYNPPEAPPRRSSKGEAKPRYFLPPEQRVLRFLHETNLVARSSPL